MDIWWTLHLRREPASVSLARRILLGTMESAGVDEDIAHEIALALSEACANAVEHAAGPYAAREYRVTATISGDHCRIEVADHGWGATGPTRTVASTTLTAEPSLRRRSRRYRGGAYASAAMRARAARVDTSGINAASLSAVQRGHGRPVGPTPTPDPFDLTRVPEPPTDAERGRGLHLIRALSDSVQFRRHPDTGSVVSFDKTLKWRPGRPMLAAS
ncbi:ATP-binding protein [Allostreptomyces psammosilenae]|uniref:Serine/threonine-protein kinase RsbW n=1 Tax=Allostreptomyces psammosilenae TaxID=1892865 RepID=A0A852ZW59_9ACTN|nr:ATP-binding protein [Allostreptomyces psammosilenae]NYI05490.1 serine/threonine-protein kinase RsbW [Allostreptomyces psammosilenae]